MIGSSIGKSFGVDPVYVDFRGEAAGNIRSRFDGMKRINCIRVIPMETPQKRKPPRFNPTETICKNVAKHGLKAHVVIRPDGTTEIEISSKRGAAKVVDADDAALAGDEAQAHIDDAIAAIRNGGRSGERQD